MRTRISWCRSRKGIALPRSTCTICGRSWSRSFPGISFAFLPADIVSQILNFGLPAPIDIQIVGRDLEGNRRHALKLMERLNRVDGLVDLRIQQPFDQPKLHINVDRTKAQDAGFSLRDVASNLLISLSGSFQTSPNFWLDPTNRVAYQIAVQTPQYEIDSLDALGNIPVTNAAGAKPEILSTMATINRGSGQALLSHYNVQPVIDIYGGVQRRDLGGVADEVSRIVDDSRKELPRGSSIVIRGQVQTMASSFSGLLIGLVFAIVLVYLLMVVNFQSWLDPFIIITALPGALAGIVWMLFLTHTTVSVPALTGAIMCIGIATANSILVVSFARDQVRSGQDAFAAALQAGVTRLRPVMMTALAMVIGMVPMALGLGEGGEQNAPLGRAVIGGLLFATVATLFFVPDRVRRHPQPSSARLDGISRSGTAAGAAAPGALTWNRPSPLPAPTRPPAATMQCTGGARRNRCASAHPGAAAQWRWRSRAWYSAASGCWRSCHASRPARTSAGRRSISACPPSRC